MDGPLTTPRRADIARETAETAIRVVLDLDGSGRAEIATGIGFLDHMLTALARHSMIDMTIADVPPAQRQIIEQAPPGIHRSLRSSGSI